MRALLLFGLLLSQAAPVSAPPVLTEVEALHIQILTLQQQLVNANSQLEICRIEAAHPGHKFDPAKGLVPK